MTIPTAPSNLTATALTASRVDLSWQDNSNNEANFELQRSPNGTTGWTLIASPAANVTHYSNTGLASNTRFYYRIRAVNVDGNSAYSPVVSALTLLVSRAIQPRLFLLQPTVVFAARVVLLDPADYPISFIAYDTVTTGDYTDIRPGMTLLLGSTPGGDQYGRQRVRGPETPATTISIFVGRSSRGIADGELTIVDGAYISIWEDRRVWAKIPFIDADGRIFKDSDLEVGDRTTNPPPVAIMGEGDARTIDPDTGVTTVLFNGQPSYATADGASITDFLWNIKDCTLDGGALTDDNITITCPPGFRYIELTVTDSNGHTATTARPVYARDPDNDTSFDGFAIESQRITDAGQTMNLRILEDMPRATYPDGTLAMIWDSEPTGAANRDHMLIIGWLDSEDASHNAGRTGLLRDTTITIQDVAARLDTLPGFSQSVADDDTRLLVPAVLAKIPDITWNFMVAPTMDKYMHYLMAWHSTALEVADFYWSDTGTDYQVAIKSSDGESLWNQVSRLAGDMIPGYVLTCEQAGRIRMEPDPMLLDSADRTSTVQAALTEDDFSDLRVTYQRAPKTHWLRTGALVVQASIAFNTDGSVHLPTVFSIAPGDTPGQGLGEIDNNEGLVSSQDVLNSATGHKYARMNSPLGLITVTLIQDDQAGTVAPWREIEPALKQWVTIRLGADYAAQRGLTFDTVRALPKEVNIRYNQSKTGLTRTVELTAEIETVGVPAATVTKPTVPAVGDDPAVVPPPIPPPDDGLITGQDMIAAIGKFGVYCTNNFTTPSGSGGPTYDFKNLTGSDEMLTWVVDPFSPGYIEGSGTIDGWAASATKLYRLANLFGATPAATAVITFANTAQWRTIQASFGTYFARGSNPWLVCISYYGSLGGHTGTWATYSLDGGVTWADEVQVSAFYDSGGAVNPIGLYCSPKTPGLAYTAAHIATANPATAHGYVSTDWGATWTEIPATEDPANPLPRWGVVDGSTWVEGDLTNSASLTVTASASSGSTVNISNALVLGLPLNTKRAVIHGAYSGNSESHGVGSSVAGQLSFPKDSAITRTVVNAYAPSGNPYSGTFDFEYTYSLYATHDWPGNRTVIEGTPPSVTPSNSSNVRFSIQQIAIAGGTGSAMATETVTLTITEIELDDGTIYAPHAPGIIAPVHGQAGEIHLPWPDNDAEDVIYYGALDRSGNRQFALMRATAGVVVDISPHATIDYGINHGHFAVRTYDSDRSKVVAAGTGNDASSSSSGDKQGVWVSSDDGDTWTQIVAPTTSTEPYSAAFGGDDSDVIYVWGPASYIKYSSNFGSSLDDRSGNLSALSATHLIGIAGGPTP